MARWDGRSVPGFTRPSRISCPSASTIPRYLLLDDLRILGCQEVIFDSRYAYNAWIVCISVHTIIRHRSFKTPQFKISPAHNLRSSLGSGDFFVSVPSAIRSPAPAFWKAISISASMHKPSKMRIDLHCMPIVNTHRHRSTLRCTAKEISRDRRNSVHQTPRRVEAGWPLPDLRSARADRRRLSHGALVRIRRTKQGRDSVVQQRLPRHGAASRRSVRDARGIGPLRRGLGWYAKYLGHGPAACRTGNRACRSSRQGSSTAVHLRLDLKPCGTRHTRVCFAWVCDLLRRSEP